MGSLGRGAPAGRRAGCPGATGARALPPPDDPRPAWPGRSRVDPRVRARAGRRADRLTATWPRSSRHGHAPWPPTPIHIARSGSSATRRSTRSSAPTDDWRRPTTRRRRRIGAAPVPGDPGRVRPDRRSGCPSSGGPAEADPPGLAGRGRRIRPAPAPRTAPTAGDRGHDPVRDPSGGRIARVARHPRRVAGAGDRHDPIDRRTRRRWARRRMTGPMPNRWIPTGAARRGTGPARARIGRSTPRNTPTRASTVRNTRPGRDGPISAERGCAHRHRRPSPALRAPKMPRPRSRATLHPDRPRRRTKPPNRRRTPQARGGSRRRRAGRARREDGPGRGTGAPLRPAAPAPPRTPPPAAPRRSRAAAAAEAAADGEDISTEAVLDAIRRWIDDRRPGVGARIGRAVIGWAPIALGIGWFAGEMSGCSRFSAIAIQRSPRSRGVRSCWCSRYSSPCRGWLASRRSPRSRRSQRSSRHRRCCSRPSTPRA